MLKDLWNQAGKSFITQLYDFHLTLSLLCSQCFSHYNSTCGSDSQLFHVSGALPPLFTSHHSCSFFNLAFDSKVNFSMFNIQITTVRKHQISDKQETQTVCFPLHGKFEPAHHHLLVKNTRAAQMITANKPHSQPRQLICPLRVLRVHIEDDTESTLRSITGFSEKPAGSSVRFSGLVF